MGFAEWTIVALFILGILTGIIGWLLASKDAKQEELIRDLYAKHKEDSEKLAALELDVAKNYNPKHEITELFTTFKLYLNERFDRLEHAVGVERAHKP